MPLGLTVEQFSAEKLPDVQGFDCGFADTHWGPEITQWIKRPASERRSALWSMANRQTRVFLFYVGADLAGYGSVGLTSWSRPSPDGQQERIAVIPCFGVDARFQRLPATS